MANAKRTRTARDGRQTPAGRSDQTAWDLLDSHCEVATVLLSKRWEQQEEPFQGFNSPPGKF